jgi:hypothetical protein
VPFRALPDARLRDRLVEEAARLTVALNELSGDSARDGVLFTGRRMTAADFAMHSRSECALHRWDLVGRDDIGWAMLSQPELTAHAITVLAGMSSLPEAPANRLVRERGRRTAGGGPQRTTRRRGAYTLRRCPHSRADTDRQHPTERRARRRGASAAPLGRREPSAPIDLNAGGDEMITTLLGW